MAVTETNHSASSRRPQATQFCETDDHESKQIRYERYDKGARIYAIEYVDKDDVSDDRKKNAGAK